METLGRSPKGFQGVGYGIRVSGAAGWVGGTHGADSETISLGLSWFFGASGVRRRPRGADAFGRDAVGGGKKNERGGGGAVV